MNEFKIAFEGGRTEFEPGETIAVDVEWSLPIPPDEVKLQAVWNTVGKGTTDTGIEETVMIGNPRQADSRRVEITLPAAPYSFSGKLVSLVWALELVAGPSRSFRTEITIAPGASEVLLHSGERNGTEGDK